eukprot:SAG31_NODE_3576_length_4107_cov_4.203593_5_plen_176_part_00
MSNGTPTLARGYLMMISDDDDDDDDGFYCLSKRFPLSTHLLPISISKLLKNSLLLVQPYSFSMAQYYLLSWVPFVFSQPPSLFLIVYKIHSARASGLRRMLLSVCEPRCFPSLHCLSVCWSFSACLGKVDQNLQVPAVPNLGRLGFAASFSPHFPPTPCAPIFVGLMIRSTVSFT